MTDPKRARCWDKDWKYTPKDATDIRVLFRRVAREQKEAQKSPPANVTKLKRKS